jgi:3-hydroxyisobutyrate dehydrogenase
VTKTIAVLGTGTMGAPMARNLIAAGFDVRVWNRSPGKTAGLDEAGALIAGSAVGAVQNADFVLTMLYDADSVLETMIGVADHLSPDTLWLQMTTVGPDGGAELQDFADKTGLTMIDAPVLGTRDPAEKGALTILASGPVEARERSAAVFDALGERTLWIDAPQGGQRLKLVANTWVLTATEAVAEALRLAAALDLDPALFTEAITGTANDMPYAHLKARAIRESDYRANFALDNALKDAQLIVATADAAGVNVAVVDAVRKRLERASKHGHGAEDIAAIALAG